MCRPLKDAASLWRLLDKRGDARERDHVVMPIEGVVPAEQQPPSLAIVEIIQSRLTSDIP